MKISVITVCFNCAAHLGDSLVSVDVQQGVTLEHIIIDGASSDSTLDVIRCHAAPWRHVVSEADHGIYDAMNKGVSRANGDWIGFLNADDIFASSKTLASIAAAVSQGGYDIVYGDLVYVSARDTTKVLRTWTSGPFDPRSLKFGWMPPHPTFYVRRKLIQELGSFDASLRIAADYEFMLRCLTSKGVKVAYIPEVLVRMRAGGASNRSLAAMWRKSREDLTAMRRSGVGGVGTLLCKNVRKLPQFFRR